MATIVFTVVGSAIGGPIGALIGSAIGQQVDSAIFASGKRREGPRIKELAVQTSSYGTQIPAVFGAMRVAGSVIWSTDLIEKRSRSGGKGRPTTVNYSYSVSMAVALSSRPIARVGRIWADGNLLRGAQGDFKVATDFRFHAGYADQTPDPLIASAETIANCPAYRDFSYAVFENLQLADFGNRIPSLTFELFERDGSVLVSEIINTASDGLISGSAEGRVTGYALQGDSARAAIAPLLEAGVAHVRPTTAGLQLYRPETAGAFAGDIRPIAANEQRSASLDQSRMAARREPVAVSLRYYDAQRDYQIGVQRSGWSRSGEIDQQLDLPAVVDAPTAQGIAQNVATARRLRRDRRRIAIATGAAAPEIGQSIGDTSMRIIEIEHFSGYSVLSCERTPAGTGNAEATDAGRHQPSPDLSAGQTIFEIVELPSLGAAAATAPVVALVAGGTGAGWRRAAISRNLDGALTDLGSAEPASAIGVSLNPVSAHSPNLIDDFNELVVRIDTNAAPPEPAAPSPLAADAPTLMLGSELIRYGSIEPVGNAVYKLRNLLRDGAKTGAATHPAGTRAVFLDRNSLLLPAWGSIPPGSEVSVEAVGLADQTPVSRTALVVGTAIRPLAPVHLRSERVADGSATLHWVRRARHDPGWLDHVDLPLVEGSGRFLVAANADNIELFMVETSDETAGFSAATIASWALPPGIDIQFSVRQIGDYGLSDAATLRFAI